MCGVKGKIPAHAAEQNLRAAGETNGDCYSVSSSGV